MVYGTGLVRVYDIKDNDFIFALSGSLLKMKGNRSQHCNNDEDRFSV